MVKKIVIYITFCTVLGGFAVIAYVISHTEKRDLARELIAADGHVAKAYFSPDDGMRDILIALIDAELKSIKCAIYTLTDKNVSQAFLKAARRGVQIECVVDRSFSEGRYSRVPELANAQIPLWVYQTGPNEREAGLMHNKFCLFQDTVGHKALVWTGSYNFTKRAHEKNEENVVILSDKQILTEFNDYFERLKRKSLQISGYPQKTPPLTRQQKPDWFTRILDLLS